MKKLLLATTACVGFAAAAHAADLPMRAAPPPVYSAPAFTWTGFYIGVNAGYAFDTRNRDDNNNFGGGNNLFVPGPTFSNVGYFAVAPGGAVYPQQFAPFNTANGGSGTVPLPGGGFNNFDDNRNRGGFSGGGQIGYNWQLTPGAGFVIGIEADAQYADLNRNNQNDGFFGGGNSFGAPINAFAVVPGASGVFAAPLVNALPGGRNVAGTLALTDPNGNGFGNRQGIDWFGTVRGRLGYAFDRTLIYVTGGLAYGGGSRNDNFSTNNGNFFFNTNNNFDDNNRIRIGYAVGGGLEYAFTNNLTAKIEGLYVSLENRNNNNNGLFNNPGRYAQDSAGFNYYAPSSAFSNNGGFLNNRRREGEFAVVRVGLNYKFGGFDSGPSAPVVARY